MRLRVLAAAALGPAALLAALGVAAGPAFAHEEIDPKVVPAGRAAFLTLIAANESSSDVVKIALRAPAQMPFGTATRSPAGWSAAVAGNTVTWTGGALKPGTFESFGFETEGADQPGTFTYAVTSTNTAGRNDTHEVDVAVTSPGAATATTSPASVTSVTSAPSVAEGTTTTAAAAAGSDEDDDDGSGLAVAALVVAVVALLAAVGALVRGGRGSSAAPGSGPSAAGGAPGAAQDW